MNRFLQVISVFATAIGCGLFVFGDFLFGLDVTAAAVFRGLGAGFFVLGLLGLVVPVINARTRERTSGNSEASPPEKPQN